MNAAGPFAEDTAVLRVLFAILICSTCGCGTFTCLNMANENPRTETIYGGVRTDANCILNYDAHAGNAGMWHRDPFGKYTLKLCSIIDLPFSFVADTLMLPYAIWKTSKNKSLPSPEAKDEGKIEKPTESDLTLPRSNQ